MKVEITLKPEYLPKQLDAAECLATTGTTLMLTDENNKPIMAPKSDKVQWYWTTKLISCENGRVLLECLAFHVGFTNYPGTVEAKVVDPTDFAKPRSQADFDAYKKTLSD